MCSKVPLNPGIEKKGRTWRPSPQIQNVEPHPSRETLKTEQSSGNNVCNRRSSCADPKPADAARCFLFVAVGAGTLLSGFGGTSEPVVFLPLPLRGHYLLKEAEGEFVAVRLDGRLKKGKKNNKKNAGC